MAAESECADEVVPQPFHLPPELSSRHLHPRCRWRSGRRGGSLRRTRRHERERGSQDDDERHCQATEGLQASLRLSGSLASRREGQWLPSIAAAAFPVVASRARACAGSFGGERGRSGGGFFCSLIRRALGRAQGRGRGVGDHAELLLVLAVEQLDGQQLALHRRMLHARRASGRGRERRDASAWSERTHRRSLARAAADGGGRARGGRRGTCRGGSGAERARLQLRSSRAAGRTERQPTTDHLPGLPRLLRPPGLLSQDRFLRFIPELFQRRGRWCTVGLARPRTRRARVAVARVRRGG